MTLLSPGDEFPALTVNTADRELHLPDVLSGDFGVVLFNRGAWCPYCGAQLRSFRRALPKLVDVGATVVALGADDEATTKEFGTKNSITFPLGYGVNATAVAAVTGAFVHPEPVFLQSTGFVLDPAGRVLVRVPSSGAIGRLGPEDVVGMIRRARSQG
jgi:peroxiredoxin